MGSPLSFGDCVAIVEKTVALYDKIRHEVPEQIQETGKRVEAVLTYLKRLQPLLQTNGGLANLQPGLTEDLQGCLVSIRQDVQRVEVLLTKWNSKQAIGGLEWKSKTVSQAFFALGSGPKELASLCQKLDNRLREMDQLIQILQSWALNAILGQPSKTPQSTSPAPPPKSPTQLPVAPRRPKYDILFVSTDGEGRARVAEMYANIIARWAIATDQSLPIDWIHSAGLHVRARSETAALQEALHMEMRNGGRSGNKAAVAALYADIDFDKLHLNGPIPGGTSRPTRGLKEATFEDYDFILCFNRMNLANLENLRDAIAKKRGRPQRRSKIALLGAYGKDEYNEHGKEIWHPEGKAGGVGPAQNWTSTGRIIQSCFQGFLRAELGWNKPLPAIGKTSSS